MNIFNTFLVFILFLPSIVFGSNFCNDCDFSNDLSCLSRQYLCGHYFKIIEDFSMHSILKDEELYYLGASYYGVFHEVSGIGMRCYMAIHAQSLLRNYLTRMYKEKYVKTGRLGDQANFIKVKESLSILNDLENASFCFDGRLSKNEILTHARYFTHEEIEKIFFKKNHLISSLIEGMNDSIRSIITKSSDFEDVYKAKRQEGSSGQRYIDDIEKIIKNHIGSIVKSENGIVINDTEIDKKLSEISLTHNEVMTIQSEFQKKLGNVTPEEYEEMRQKQIHKNNLSIEKITSMINFIECFFEPFFKTKILELKSKVQSQFNDKEPSIDDLESMWHIYGTKTSFSLCQKRPNLWFCKGDK